MGLPAVCNDNDYKNWVRACLGLKFLKEGLVNYVDNEVQAFHRDILVNVCGLVTCNGCTTDEITRRPRPRPCPNNVCDKIRDKIQTEYRYRTPQWDNTDATKWCTNHWEIAKCFMSPGHKAVTSSADSDTTGILSICINGLFMPMARQIIPAQHQPPVDIYHKNRTARNTILHSGSMSLSDIERQDFIQDMITLLANYKHPVDTVTQDAIDKLRQLNGGLFITPTDELTALKSKLDTIDKSQQDITTKVDIVQQEQQDLQGTVDDIREQTNTVQQDVANKLVDMQQQYDSSRLDIEAVQQEQGRVDIVSIEQQIQKNGEALSELNEKLLQYQLVTGEGIRDVKQQYSSLIDRNDALHKLITDLPARVESIEGEMIHQASRIDKMDARMGDIEDRTMSLAAKAIQTHVMKNTKSDVLGAENSGIADRQQTLRAIQNYLVAKYKAELKTISMPPLLQRIKVNIDDVYTELVIRDDLVHKKKETAPEDEKSKAGNTSKLGNRVKNYTDILHDGKKTCTNVFVIGKAGVGKTTWSRKLISTWCDTMNQGTSNTTSSSNDAALRKYDLVFYIELRSAKSLSHVMNMIQDQIFPHEPDLMRNVKTLMENEEYSSRFLIVLDGLDEWVSRDQSKTKNGLPARDPRWKSTIITTTRSWKLEELQLETQAIDRAVEIQGLQEDGAKRLVKEVVSALNTSRGKHKDVDEFNNQCPELVHRCMEVPLLLNTFVCLWYEEGRIDELLAGTFCALVELLIKYAEGDARTRLFRKIPTEKLEKAKQTWKDEISGVPDFFVKRHRFSMYGPFLLRLGKIAFDHLFSRSRESSLVFDHQTITDVISEEELEIAVTIGLLSQTTHCGSVLEEQFSLSFLHKTLQEFLASVYMVSNGCQSNPCLDTYRDYCTDVYKVLEMENVLMFVTGMCPEMAGEMSRHIASMERNEKVHKLLLRCVKQERITSSTFRYIYIKHHFLNPSYETRDDGFDYNTETISLLSISNDKDTTLCLERSRTNALEILKCIADITNVKLVEANLCCSMMAKKQTIEFEKSVSVMNNKLIKIDSACSKIIVSGAFLEKLHITSYKPISEQCKLDLSGCKSLKTVEYWESTAPIQLPAEQLERVEIMGYNPHNAPVLDLSGCKSFRTVRYQQSTAPIQLLTEQLEKVLIISYNSRNAPVLDLSGCKSLRTVEYMQSTAPIQLPTEQLEKVVIYQYTPDNAPVLDLSGCKSLRTVEYKKSTAPIQLPTEQLERVEIISYNPHNAPVLDLSGCKSLRTVQYIVSTVPIQLPTEQLEEVVLISYKPHNAPVLDLSGCKSLRTVDNRGSTAPIQLPTEQLEKVVLISYKPRNAPVLDLSGCNTLRTVEYKKSTAPIQLPTEQLEKVVIENYKPDNAPVLDLSGCKSLRTVGYKESTIPIQLPTEQLEIVVIENYTPDNAPVLDLSGCKSLRTVQYRRSTLGTVTVPIQLPTEQLEKVEIHSYTPRDAPVLDLSGCKTLRTVEYKKSTAPIQLPTEQLEKVVIENYKPDNAPVLDLSGCKSLRTVVYTWSPVPIQLPAEQLEKVVIENYKPDNAPVLDLSGCKSLKCIRYSLSTAPVLLPPEQVLKTEITKYTPQKYWWEDLIVPEPILYRDMCVLEVDPSCRNLIRRH